MVTIGELGKKTKLSTKTIRFYETIGLIQKPKRADNGYRMYPSETIDELSLIKNARDLGLPIAQIKKLMQGCDNGNCEHTRQYLHTEIDTYLAELQTKIIHMENLKQRLTTLQQTVIDTCKEKANCNILGQLAKLPKGGE